MSSPSSTSSARERPRGCGGGGGPPGVGGAPAPRPAWAKGGRATPPPCRPRPGRRGGRPALPHTVEPWVGEQAAADLSWRHEADVYRGGLDDVLPPGMRMPRRYRVDDLGDDRVAEWLEDVPMAPVRWDLPRFAHAARLL